jgi:tetratricopeptide (TPR) repeat protein
MQGVDDLHPMQDDGAGHQRRIQRKQSHTEEKDMSDSKFSFTLARVLLCLIASVTPCCWAQEWTKDPTTWWPDPSTGLIWTGQVHGSPHPDPKLASPYNALGKNGLSWQQANLYCASLHLAGSNDWRLPTLDEVKAATVMRKAVGPYPASYGTENKAMREQDNAVSQIPYDALFFKRGGIETFGRGMILWTSTLLQTDNNSAWVVALDSSTNPFSTAQITHPFLGVLCVRPMEPDLLRTAKAAAVDHPVPDIQTLQTFIPLNKARLAYQAGNYQESITQAQIALSLKADPATDYWGIGLSYGRLGQWGQAIANLESALVIDKNFVEAQTSLKWAKDGLKAAKKGKLPKESNPTWN